MIKKNYKKRVLISAIPIIIFLFTASIIVWQQIQTETKTNQNSNNIVNTKKDTSVSKEESEIPDTVKIGAYIFSVYDLDFPNNKVNVDFYLWYIAPKDSMSLLENLEVTNSSEVEKSYEMNEKRGDKYFQSVRIKAKIKQDWKVENFPFDKQLIKVKVEDFDKDNTKLIFIADTSASKLDKDIHIDGWKFMDFGIKIDNHLYETNYGDPDIPVNEYSSYSRATLNFTLEREGNGLFFKLFIGLFISVLISLLTFFVNPLDLDPRFGLSVGAIFAAIASQYVITSTLPQNEKLTLVDKLHDVSFIYIFICILVSTISLRYMKQGMTDKSIKLDRYSFLICASTYLIFVIYFISKSI
ncbi:MAG: hypothetical protein IT280_10535 [Ignavibacteria bacterium]|nr:hypothetical protein [Ignavibacteria bacterium]